MMKNRKMIVAVLLALLACAGCAALMLFLIMGGGPAQSSAADSVSGPGDLSSASVLDRSLLSLLDGDNSVLREKYSGRCYAEVTQSEAARLTYLFPYLSIRFARQAGTFD